MFQLLARLTKAGLNKNLIYGTSPTSAVGNADKVAPAKAAPYNMPNPLEGINTFQDYAQTGAQTDNLKAQNVVLTQEAILKAAQTGKTLSEGSSAQTKAKVDQALLNTSIDASKENLRGLEQDTIGKLLDNKFKDGALKDRLKKIYYEAQNAKSTLTGTQLQNTIKKYEIELNKLGVQKNDPIYFRILGYVRDEMNKSIKNNNHG